MGCGTSSAPGYAPEVEKQLSDRIVDFTPLAPAYVPSTFHGEYVLEERLRVGSGGFVYAARLLANDARVAVKDSDGRRTEQIDMTSRRAMESEVAVLRKLPPSSNVVKFHRLFTGGAVAVAYLVMEQCRMWLPDFLETSQAVTEMTLRRALKDMLSALVACHAAGIVHGDVRPESFLASEGPDFPLKLCGFGQATALSLPDAKTSGLVGAPAYRSRHT